MARLQNCQFIEIKVDGSAIGGFSEEGSYKNWIEGFADSEISVFTGQDSVFYESVDLSIPVTKETIKVYEKYLSKGHKDITITIVHRGSDKLNQDYEAQRMVYSGCSIQMLKLERNEDVFMRLSFLFEESIEVTFNAPNAKGDGLDKVGPVKYSIPEKKIV